MRMLAFLLPATLRCNILKHFLALGTFQEVDIFLL